MGRKVDKSFPEWVTEWKMWEQLEWECENTATTYLCLSVYTLMVIKWNKIAAVVLTHSATIQLVS